MIDGYSPVWQGLMGTLFTWFVTAVGAGAVFWTDRPDPRFLDGSLGFAAGVMLAASNWSLLTPALEMSEERGYGVLSFLPAALGLVGGAAAVCAGEKLLEMAGMETGGDDEVEVLTKRLRHDSHNNNNSNNTKGGSVVRRKGRTSPPPPSSNEQLSPAQQQQQQQLQQRRAKEREERMVELRSVILLVAAITLHNFPEGLAVGVGFGAVGRSASATVGRARRLAVGIGLQNLPEGAAVSLPLRRAGFSRSEAFFWGQLSGMVEPLGGLLGSAAVAAVEPSLPYALASAAGAMLYVVVDELVPRANGSGHPRTATWGCVVGFALMMSMDVALG